jgi:hypothetical protein
MDKEQKHSFNWRGFVSVTAGLSFLGLAVTGVVLFFTPSGRIANWTGWSFVGLSRHQWIGLHICLSILFLIVALLHVFYNWKCLVGYFKDKTRRRLALRWEWGAALLLVWVVSAGTVTGMVPIVSFLNWHTAMKHGHVREASQPSDVEAYSSAGRSGGYGGGFGRMTLKVFCDAAGLDPSKACEVLEHAGLTAQAEMTLRDIANTGQIHPSQIRRLLQP